MNHCTTSGAPARTSNPATQAKFQPSRKDPRDRCSPTARAAETAAAEDRRFRRLQDDWRMLAGEWLTLAEAIEQFRNEFEGSETDFNIRWKQHMSAQGDSPFHAKEPFRSKSPNQKK